MMIICLVGHSDHDQSWIRERGGDDGKGEGR